METKLVPDLKCLTLIKNKILFKDIYMGFSETHVKMHGAINEEDYFAQITLLRPQFVIIEIDPKDTDTTYNLIHKHAIMYRDAMPIFLVGNTNNLHIFSEGMRLGANDFFLRPLDFDLMATKINQYFVNTELEHHELSYNKVPIKHRKIELLLKFKVLALEETGLLLKSNHYFCKNAKLNMENSQLKKMLEVNDLVLTVCESIRNDKGEIIVHALFPDDITYTLAARRLIMQLQTKKSG